MLNRSFTANNSSFLMKLKSLEASNDAASLFISMQSIIDDIWVSLMPEELLLMRNSGELLMGGYGSCRIVKYCCFCWLYCCCCWCCWLFNSFFIANICSVWLAMLLVLFKDEFEDVGTVILVLGFISTLPFMSSKEKENQIVNG